MIRAPTKIYMFLKVACLFPSGISLLYIHSSHVIVIHLSSYQLLYWFCDLAPDWAIYNMIARFEHIALSSSKNLLCPKSVPKLWYYVCYILKRIIIPCTNHLALLEECPWQLALSLSHHERVLVFFQSIFKKQIKKSFGESTD